MIEVLLVIVIFAGAFGWAEWKHQKTGNGKRFEQIHYLISDDGKTENKFGGRTQ